jgi:hypothetical protein
MDGFKEALQRDPKQQRQWIVVIDGRTASTTKNDRENG